MELQEKLEKIQRECPMIPHTDAGRMFSMVRRMKAEKELEIPIPMRSSFIISARLGKAANEMSGEEWEEFYEVLAGELYMRHPELFKKIFGK